MKKYFLKDASLQNIDDDRFRYQDYVNNLRRLIDCNEAPFNIAIIGKWGLGKSSLVNMALAPLKKEKDKFLICDINAWKYEKEEIGKAFIKELWEKIHGERVLSFHFFHKEYSDIVREMFEERGKHSKDSKPEKKSKISEPACSHKTLQRICTHISDTAYRHRNFIKFLINVILMFLVSIIVFGIYCGFSNAFYGIAFQNKGFLVSTALRYCKNMGTILIIPLVVWWGKLFMDKLNEPTNQNYSIGFPLQTQSDYEIYLDKILQEFRKDNSDKKILVVVDELDRLSADKIVEAIDALKLFMEYEQFIFIVPFDDEVLKAALEQKRIRGVCAADGEYDGEMILDKIFQYKLYLPRLIKYDMRNYAFEICEEDCADFIVEYCGGDRRLFEETVGKILIHNGVATPRQVKKIVNTFIENTMIARDREQAGKVTKGFASSKKGLQSLARLSVLQADYNEFYDLLFQDANAADELLAFHRGEIKDEAPEAVRRYFDANGRLQKKYEPLLNFLTFTEKLGYDNLTPYLYMTQTREGALVGDKRQQDFAAAMESCNLVTVRQMVNESPVLVALFLEELKFDESPMMGNIMLSAIDSYDIVPEEMRQELAAAIVERIDNIDDMAGELRCDMLNVENLIALCRAAGSEIYDSLIKDMINRRRFNADYKDGAELIDRLMRIEDELSEETLATFECYVRAWIASDESDIQDIAELVKKKGVEKAAALYGKEYIGKAAEHITGREDFNAALLGQFGDMIRSFLKNGTLEELENILLPCYDYPELYKLLDEAITARDYQSISDAREMAVRIVARGVDGQKGVYGFRILAKLSYTVTEADGKRFDAFFKGTVGETEFADMIRAFAGHNNMALLQSTVNELTSRAFGTKGYETVVRELLVLYTPEQKKKLLDRLTAACKYNTNTNANSQANAAAGYERAGSLIAELSKEPGYHKDITGIIEKTIIPGVKTYYSKKSYLALAIRAVGAYSAELSANTIDEYSAVLIKALTVDKMNALDAYRSVNRLISASTWKKNINSILNQVSKETYAVIYDIVTERKKLFTKADGNLSKLADFLVDHIAFADNPDDVIDTLSGYFSRISGLDRLIHALMDLEYDENNAANKLAELIDACELASIIKIISAEWQGDENRRARLGKLLSGSKKYSGQALPNSLNESRATVNKNDLLLCLEFCAGAVSADNLEAVTELMKYLLSDYFEKDVCSQILALVEKIPIQVIANDRETVCEILADIFKRSSSDDNRAMSAFLIKDKRLGRRVKKLLTEEEMKAYKAYLEK